LKDDGTGAVTYGGASVPAGSLIGPLLTEIEVQVPGSRNSKFKLNLNGTFSTGRCLEFGAYSLELGTDTDSISELGIWNLGFSVFIHLRAFDRDLMKHRAALAATAASSARPLEI
jgi:hypothetical protein